MHQVRLFLCAVQFLTRLPTPPLTEFEPDWITRSAKYFPLVGQIVGALCAGVFILAHTQWQNVLPALLALTVGVLITGAFHEDGLADTADGLGGGQNRAQRLAIMKDSRIGTYGALALLAALGLKAATLGLLSVTNVFFVLIAMHGTARAAAVIVMARVAYAGDPNLAKAKPAPMGVTPRECLLATIFSLWPLFFLPPSMALYGVVTGAILASLVAFAAWRLIGGYTGDVLGAVEQAFEVGFLLGVTASL